jgi:hypothetical protein
MKEASAEAAAGAPAPAATEPPPAAEPEPSAPAQEAGPPPSDLTSQNGDAASPTPRRRPRPRPQPADGSTTPAKPTAPPHAPDTGPGAAAAQAGFGPTSVAGTPAVPHALFTPASKAGVGGALPGPDGAAPGPEFTIKGNADSMLFHTPDSPYYGRTRAEVWFRTADEAVAAGFTEWRRHRRSTG